MSLRTESLFSAIERRFDSDAALSGAGVGRKLYQGFEGQSLKNVLPFVECTIAGPEADSAFGLDINAFTMTFTAFGNESLPGQLDDILDALRRVFDDCDLDAAEFDTAMFHRTGGGEPSVEDGLYRASLDYECTVSQTTLVPMTKGGV